MENQIASLTQGVTFSKQNLFSKNFEIFYDP